MDGDAAVRASRWWLDPEKVEGYVHGVFEGGGAKGVLYVGALKALLERKLWFSAVAGSSAGAITAAMIAAGTTPEEIERYMDGGLDALELPTTWSGLRRVIKAVGFLDRDEVLKWLRGILQAKCGLAGQDRGPTFEALYRQTNIDLFVVAVDLTANQLAVFNRKLSPRCDVADAVIASATIPLAFEPSRFSERDENDRPVHGSPRYFADGGIASNFPDFVFRDEAFRAHAGLDPPSHEPLVGFLLDESSGEPEPEHPYLGGRFEGTYHDWVQALTDRKMYRIPRFRKRRQTQRDPNSKHVGARVLNSIEIFVLMLLGLLGRGFSGPEWPEEWISRKKVEKGTSADADKPSKEPDPRVGLLLKSLQRWISAAPGILILGVAVYTAMFWLGAITVFRTLAPDSADLNFGDIYSVLGYIFLWLLTVAVTVFAVIVWLMGLLSLALLRITYRTAALYGVSFVRTFLNTPAAPPWAGKGRNERLVRLAVRDGTTTLGVRDRTLLAGFLAECQRDALVQLDGVKGHPVFPREDEAVS